MAGDRGSWSRAIKIIIKNNGELFSFRSSTSCLSVSLFLLPSSALHLFYSRRLCSSATGSNPHTHYIHIYIYIYSYKYTPDFCVDFVCKHVCAIWKKGRRGIGSPATCLPDPKNPEKRSQKT